MVSAIGNDVLGTKLLEYIQANGVEASCIQVTNAYNTGVVQVNLNKNGSATYDIATSAWDKISLTKEMGNLVKNADALVFGSLVTRDNLSKNTLYNLIELSKYNIFDLNLRPPHYSKDILMYLMQKADFIKFNDDELYEVAGF
ncbi:fructokinase [Jejuia pallidilutea]|uniref:Fructokinase n=2 Tax=Jejuia pallidilutea TaxID=504487 RepID=A0A090VYP3_9FLAO|nr:fructokinase [Jejuia pallidilutea]